MTTVPVSVALTVLAVTCWQYAASETFEYSYALYGRTYRFAVGDDMKTGAGARIQCAGEGGSLVDIRSDPEAEHLAGAARSMGIPMAARRFLVGGMYKQSIWDAGKTIWYYENNDMMLYTNWSPGQPVADANRTCIAMVATDFNGKWRNVDCSARMHYICTKDESTMFKYGFHGKTYFVPTLDSRHTVVGGVDAMRLRCKNYGGVLVDIHSAEELQHVKRVAVGLKKPYAKISNQRFAIGGRRVNDSWYYDDGRVMTYANWISGEEVKDGCVILDVDHLAILPRVLTSIEAKNYRVQPCNTANISYICSKNLKGFYMQFADTDDKEGSDIIRTCIASFDGALPPHHYRSLEMLLYSIKYRPIPNTWWWANFNYHGTIWTGTIRD